MPKYRVTFPSAVGSAHVEEVKAENPEDALALASGAVDMMRLRSCRIEVVTLGHPSDVELIEDDE